MKWWWNCILAFLAIIHVQQIQAEKSKDAVNVENYLKPQFGQNVDKFLTIQPSKSELGSEPGKVDMLLRPLNMLLNTANIDRNEMVLEIETDHGEYERLNPTPECHNIQGRYPDCQYKVAMACQSRRGQNLSEE